MLNKKTLAQSLAVVGLLATTGASQASITVYTSLAAFNAAVLSPATDTFDNISRTQLTFGPLNRFPGIYGYVATTEPNNAFYGAGTAANPGLSTDTAADTIRFSGFFNEVGALGGNFFATNQAGGFTSGDIIVTAADADGPLSRTITDATVDGFLGFVSSTGRIISTTVLAVQPGGGQFNYPTVDNLVLGAVMPAVPEPEIYALLLVGLGMVGFMARRSRAA